jgi:hypothetical protein
MVEPVPAFTVLVYQVRATKETKVFRNGRPRDGKRLGDLPGRLTPFPEQVEHRPPGRVSQSAEGGFRGICNRLVPHNA